jgi:hypothetical protein
VKRKYGEQCACKYCGHDIEFHGRKVGWIDRGAGRQCLPFLRRGEVVRPKTKHTAVGAKDWL